jgi:hypothetical protein
MARPTLVMPGVPRVGVSLWGKPSPDRLRSRLPVWCRPHGLGQEERASDGGTHPWDEEYGEWRKSESNTCGWRSRLASVD